MKLSEMLVKVVKGAGYKRDMALFPEYRKPMKMI
jgi:hypothetical protein